MHPGRSGRQSATTCSRRLAHLLLAPDAISLLFRGGFFLSCQVEDALRLSGGRCFVEGLACSDASDAQVPAVSTQSCQSCAKLLPTPPCSRALAFCNACEICVDTLRAARTQRHPQRRYIPTHYQSESRPGTPPPKLGKVRTEVELENSLSRGRLSLTSWLSFGTPPSCKQEPWT